MAQKPVSGAEVSEGGADVVGAGEGRCAGGGRWWQKGRQLDTLSSEQGAHRSLVPAYRYLGVSPVRRLSHRMEPGKMTSAPFSDSEACWVFRGHLRIFAELYEQEEARL